LALDKVITVSFSYKNDFLEFLSFDFINCYVNERQARHVTRVGDREDACRGLVGRTKRKKPRGRPMCRLEVWTGLIWLSI
jgi:hypothetical protein